MWEDAGQSGPVNEYAASLHSNSSSNSYIGWPSNYPKPSRNRPSHVMPLGLPKDVGPESPGPAAYTPNIVSTSDYTNSNLSGPGIPKTKRFIVPLHTPGIDSPGPVTHAEQWPSYPTIKKSPNVSFGKAERSSVFQAAKSPGPSDYAPTTPSPLKSKPQPPTHLPKQPTPQRDEIQYDDEPLKDNNSNENGAVALKETEDGQYEMTESDGEFHRPKLPTTYCTIPKTGREVVVGKKGQIISPFPTPGPFDYNISRFNDIQPSQVISSIKGTKFTTSSRRPPMAKWPSPGPAFHDPDYEYARTFHAPIVTFSRSNRWASNNTISPGPTAYNPMPIRSHSPSPIIYMTS